MTLRTAQQWTLEADANGKHPSEFQRETPQAAQRRTEIEREKELDFLTRMICDRLRLSFGHGLRLQCALNRTGWQPITHLFSQEIQRCDPHDSSLEHSSPAIITDVRPQSFDDLSLEIEKHLYQRLAVEAERQGYWSGRLPW